MTTIYTIGHSTLPIDEFVSLLRHYDIQTLADIRSHPGSRRCPQYNTEFMSGYLRDRGIGYVHIAKLGGRRPKQKLVDPQINSGWQNASFKNYADYTLTMEFEDGLKSLLSIAVERRVAYMCSEAVPWRCHRLIVSNTLTARGHDVFHIISMSKLEKHELGKWGAPTHCECGCVTYPSDKPVQMQLSL